MAKALRDFARTNPALVVKGGLLGDEGPDAPPSARPWPTSRPARCCWPGWPVASRRRCKFAGLLQALPRNFAYGLKALIDDSGSSGGEAPEPSRRRAPAGRREPSRAASRGPAEPAEEPAAEDAPPRPSRGARGRGRTRATEAADSHRDRTRARHTEAETTASEEN